MKLQLSNVNRAVGLVVMTLLSTAAEQKACQAGGDPFYFSTWYAQPSPVLAWSSQSVMRIDAGVSPYSASGLISASSPRYFVPGYGYAQPQHFSSLRFDAYQPQWAYGVLQSSSVSTGLFNSSNSFGTSIVPGTVHQPWYLPGSPGNLRPQLMQP